MRNAKVSDVEKTPIVRVIHWTDEDDDFDFTVRESGRRLPRQKDLPRVRLQQPVDVVALLRESRDQR